MHPNGCRVPQTALYVGAGVSKIETKNVADKVSAVILVRVIKSERADLADSLPQIGIQRGPFEHGGCPFPLREYMPMVHRLTRIQTPLTRSTRALRVSRMSRA